jgi:hypothetical protein
MNNSQIPGSVKQGLDEMRREKQEARKKIEVEAAERFAEVERKIGERAVRNHLNQQARDDDCIRPDKEWEQNVSALAKKIMKVVEGMAATDAIAAMAIVLKHIAKQTHD